MRDTAELNSVLQFMKDNWITKTEMVYLFRSFGSVASMLPKGGDAIWGNTTWIPDKTTGMNKGYMITFGEMPSAPINVSEGELQAIAKCDKDDATLEMTMNSSSISEIASTSYTLNQAIDLIRKVAPFYMKKVDEFYSFGVAKDPSKKKYDDKRYWANPLETTLPKASKMKLYCLYGFGQATERAYHYHANDGECPSIPISINTGVNNASIDLNYGVQLGEGDATVPLISLGYMCVKGWKEKRFNPAELPVITREYKHTPPDIFKEAGRREILDTVLRGGAATGNHVDILGNYGFIEDIIRISSGELLEDRILSKVKEYSDRVHL